MTVLLLVLSNLKLLDFSNNIRLLNVENLVDAYIYLLIHLNIYIYLRKYHILGKST